MSKRQYREAALAKRGDIDLSRHDGRGYSTNLTDAQRDAIDAAWDRTKYDPATIAQQEHRHLEEQARMLRTLGGASI